MFNSVLPVAGFVLSTISIIAALVYLISVKRVNRLYREMHFAERESVRSKAAAYWSVETIRRRTALVGLVTYVLVLGASMVIGEPRPTWLTLCVIAASIGMGVLALTATINNMKQTEMRIEADVARRYKRIV